MTRKNERRRQRELSTKYTGKQSVVSAKTKLKSIML